MGARQSSTIGEERARSSSVDASSSDSRSNQEHRNMMTPAEFLQSIRQHTRMTSTSDSNDDDINEPGPSSSAERSMRIRGHTINPMHGSSRLRSYGRRSVPVFMLGEDLNCPVCHKRIPSDEADLHLVLCLTRPRLTYNDDILTEDKGECSICLDDMETGQSIARLPCLCIYHKRCIDDWFKRKNCCPEHPGDD